MTMPEPDKFNKEELAKIAVTPWDLHVPREAEVIFKDKSEGVHDVAKDKVVMSRQVYIKASDIDQFGMTRGCPRCDHQLKYGADQTPSQDSATGRARITGRSQRPHLDEQGLQMPAGACTG